MKGVPQIQSSFEQKVTELVEGWRIKSLENESLLKESQSAISILNLQVSELLKREEVWSEELAKFRQREKDLRKVIEGLASKQLVLEERNS